MHHPKSDVNRLHLPCKEESKDLCNLNYQCEKHLYVINLNTDNISENSLSTAKRKINYDTGKN